MNTHYSCILNTELRDKGLKREDRKMTKKSLSNGRKKIRKEKITGTWQ
jgi:hypothetical protein